MHRCRIPSTLLLALLFWASAAFPQHSVPASVYRHVDADLQQGHLADAEAELRAALKTYPQDPHALGMLGVVLDAEKKYQQAEVCYREALRIDPRSPSLLNNMGNHYLSLGDVARARRAYLDVVALDPHHSNANLQLATISVKTGQGRQALHFLSEVPGAANDQPAVKLLRAQALHLTGETAEAERLLNETESETENDPRAAFSIGMVEAQWKDYKGAERSLKLALEADPANFDVLYNFGLAAFRADDLDPAGRAFSTALREQPENVDTLYGLARVDTARKQNTDALALLVKAHHLAPQRSGILVLMGQISEQLGFYGDAVEAFTSYLKLKPQDSVIRRERAYALAHTPQIEEAVQELRHYVHAHPKDARGLIELGVAETVHEPGSALKDLSRAIALDSNMEDARLIRALVLYRAGQPQPAAADLQFILAREPKNTQALDAMGEVDLQLNKTQEAIAHLGQAANQAPDDGEILIHYARALQKANRRQEAQAALQRFEKLPPQRPRPYQGLLSYLSLSAGEQRARYWAHVRAEMQMNPQDLDLRAEWAGGQLAQGDTAGALRSFSDILSMNPPAALLEGCGETLLQYGQYAEARTFFSKAIVAYPSKAELRLDLALATFHASTPEAALAELDQTPSQQRKGDYYLLRAQILDAMGMAREAANDLSLGLRADPTRPDLYFEAALFLLKHNQARETVALLERAVQKFPDSRQLLLTQAMTYGLMRQFEKAKPIMTRIEARWPEWSEAYLIHGIILVGQAKMKEAKPLLETAIALGTRDPFAYYNLALADVEIFPADLAGATKAIQAALKLGPNDPYTQSLAGKIAYTQKNYPAALEHLKSAIRVWPDMIEAHETLSATYRAMGERQRSIAELQSILRIKQHTRSADQAPPSDLKSLLFSVPAPEPGGSAWLRK